MPLNVYLVFALNLTIGTVIQAARVLLALYALDLAARPVTVGLLAATFSLGPALLAVVAGRLADRFGARRPILAGATIGGLGLLVAYFVPGLPAIFAAGVMIGVTSALYGVSLQNLVGLLSTPKTRARNFSNYSLMGSLTNMLGPLIAGFSIEHFGHANTCVGLVGLLLVPITLLAVRRGNMRPSASRVERARGGLREMLAAPGVRRSLATGSVQSTGDSLYLFYMPVYTHAIGLSASSIGIILAVYAVAAFVVRLALPHLLGRLKEDRLVAYAFYLSAASMALVPLFHNAFMLALVSFTIGLGIGCCGPVVTMQMFGSSPAGRSGEAMGLKVTVNHVTKVVTPVVFGSIATAFGLAPVFLLNAAMLGSGGYLSHPKTVRR